MRAPSSVEGFQALGRHRSIPRAMTARRAGSWQRQADTRRITVWLTGSSPSDARLARAARARSCGARMICKPRHAGTHAEEGCWRADSSR